MPGVWKDRARRAAVFPGCCILILAAAVPALSASDTPLAEHQLIVGVLESLPPYYVLDENGNPTGFAVDAMNDVAERAGIEIAYRVVEGLNIFRSLVAGDIDIVPSVGITGPRKQIAAFTVPFETLSISLFIRDDTRDVSGMEDMKGRPVAVVVDNAAYRLLQKNPDIQLEVFSLFEDAMFALLSARVDAFAYPESIAWKLAREARIDGQIKVAARPIVEIKRAMAVRRDDKELLAVLNRAVEDFIASPEYQEIYVKWFGRPAPYWTVARVAWAMGGAMSAIFVLMGWWRYHSIVRLNNSLRESETSLKDLYENAPDMYCSVDAKTAKIVRCNETLATNLGMSKNEIVGGAVFDLYDESCHKEVYDCFHTFATNGSVESANLKLRRKNGTTIDVGLRVTAVLDMHGIITESRSVLRDITARKQAEEARKATQERLSKIFAIAPEAVITVGSDMKIQLFNAGAERIFRYVESEILGRPLEILMPEQFREIHKKHVGAFENSPDEFRFMDKRTEITGLRKDGTIFPAGASVSKLQTGGEMIFTVILHDISERRQVEKERRDALIRAEEASRAKTVFLATMSHELRTPLNAICGFSEMLSSEIFGVLGSPKYKEYAEDIHASSDHLLQLINDILDLSAIEAGKHPLTRAEIAVERTVRDCSVFIAAAAREKGIGFSSDVQKELPPLFADRRALKQILLNILSNAVKYTPDGGRVELRVSAANGYHVFETSDNGDGVPEDRIGSLTDPFVRTETDPHKAQEGTGLGLAIVKSLVDLHDGTLAIESKPGEGMTVTVALPNRTP